MLIFLTRTKKVEDVGKLLELLCLQIISGSSCAWGQAYQAEASFHAEDVCRDIELDVCTNTIMDSNQASFSMHFVGWRLGLETALHCHQIAVATTGTPRKPMFLPSRQMLLSTFLSCIVQNRTQRISQNAYASSFQNPMSL